MDSASARKVTPNANGTEDSSKRKLTLSGSFKGGSLRRPTKSQAFGLLRRLLGLLGAIYCVFISVSSGFWSLYTLNGYVDSTSTYAPYRARLIQQYLGNGTVNSSRIATELLQSDWRPRNYTAYIESETSVSYKGCLRVAKFNKELYSAAFIRSNFQSLVDQTSYNLTFLTEYELVLPVVDCTFSPINVGDSTAARVYYVMRNRRSQRELSVFMLSMSTQDYQLPDHHQLGSVMIAVVSVIHDMRATRVTHSITLALGYPFEGPNYQVYTFVGISSDSFIMLDSVPEDTRTERRTRVLTSNRSGFFIDSEQSQSNIKNLLWTLSRDPADVVSRWQWFGTTMLRNSWGWMRFVNFVFALDTTFNILVLLLVIYRNFQRGKIWIGDAFISFARTLHLRGLSILGIWVMEGFWTVLTFALDDGNKLGDGIGVFAFEEIIHGDLLTLYISLAGLLGYILHERINPALVVVLFELGYNLRGSLIDIFPTAVRDSVVSYSNVDYLRGMAALPAQLEGFSPFLFWSIHPLTGDTGATFAALLPVFSTFAVLLVYAPMRKVLRWYGKHKRTRRRTRYDISAESILASLPNKSALTVFEIATGAALQDRVGLVSDYDSCVFIKGLKFASPDGIYCNGFVIANSKFLIRTGELPWIIAIVVTGVRLRDLYVYEVGEHTVNKTARLVYPNTMTLKDLLQLNTTLLA